MTPLYTYQHYMKRSTSFTDDSELAAVRLPKILRQKALTRAKAEDLTFSQLMRRALRRDLGLIGDQEEPGQQFSRK